MFKTIYRTSGIPSFWKPVDIVKVPPYEYDSGESITDFSQFRPDSSLVNAKGAAGIFPPSAYQFPDGKDDGSPVNVALQVGADITEVEEFVHRQHEDVTQQVQKQADEVSKKERMKALQKAVTEASTKTGSSETSE